VVPAKVAVFDTATDAVIATIDLAANSSPAGIAITPDGARAYVAQEEPGNIPAHVAVIDTAANTVADHVSVGRVALAVAIRPPAHLGPACARVLTGSITATLNLTSGVTCLVNARVTALVVVRAGASAIITGSTLRSPLIGVGAATLIVCNSTVSFTNVHNSSGPVVLGQDGDADDTASCGGNTFRGSVQLPNNHGGVALEHNTIGGYLQLTNSTGPTAAELEGNLVHAFLICSGNTPAPTNDGQPNTVGGFRTGQCAASSF